MNSLESGNSALGKAGVSSRVGHSARASVAVRVHPQLAVRVNVHVQNRSVGAGRHAVKLSLESLVLDRVALGLALVVLGTGVCRSSSCLTPVVRPVAVDVSSDAARRREGLSVLTPHAVVALGVGEAIGIDDREDVEVVLVLVGRIIRIGRSEKLVCGVLDYHSGNPFASMHGSVPYHALLGALATRTPDVDSLDVATLERFSCRNDLRVAWVGSREVLQPLQMIGNRVISIEPSRIGSCRGSEVG